MPKFDKLTLSFIALVAVFVLLMAYLVTAVLRLPLTGAPDRATVHMSATGGIFEGSPVTYRGVRVGTISDIKVAESGPDATITFLKGARVPADSVAQVMSLSPVGEQYLDIRPRKDGPPWIEDKAELNAEVVELPVTIASAADNLDGLLDEINDQDIKVLMRELNAAINGSGDDLDQLLKSSSALVDSLNESFPRTQSLLRNGKTVNQILARHQQDLRSFSKSAKELTAWLVKFDPTLTRIMKEAPADFQTVGTLIQDLGPILPGLLRNLDATTGILVHRDASVRALATVTPGAVNKVSGTIRNNTWYLRAFLLGENLCDYGGPKQEGSVNNRPPLYDDGHCGSSSPERWRGARHALPPTQHRDGF